jgi:hypothetical protein
MPVTAKLSKEFYDALGEGVANELVDWFNQVDATYRLDLRELNDRNFQRFDAKMGERMAQSEARMERRMVELLIRLEAKFDAKLEKGLNDLRDSLRAEMGVLSAEMAALRAEMRADSVTKEQFADFRAEVSDKFTDLLKWMVVLWTGTVLAVITTGILT